MHDGGTPAFDLWSGLITGLLDGLTDEGRPLVRLAGGEVVEALSLVPLDLAQVGARLALGRIAEEPGRPLVIGAILPPRPRVARDDEAEQVIEARERLVLRCGPASITLFPDGRVELRGTQILSRSEGANRIQGASVHLN